MITPGLAGALTMMVTNSVCCNFGLPKPYIALVVAALIVVLAVGVGTMPLWQKSIYFLLNTLVVFTMALGANSAGDAALGANSAGDAIAKSAMPSHSFEAIQKRSSISFLASEAFAQEYTEGTLLKGSGPPVYLVIHGQRRWIPDRHTFDALGLKWNAIGQIDDGKLEAIPRGPDYPSLPGPVIKGSGPPVYLLQNGYRHWITDRKTFEAIGLRWDSVRVIPDQVLGLVPEGPPIQQQENFFSPWFKK